MSQEEKGYTITILPDENTRVPIMGRPDEDNDIRRMVEKNLMGIRLENRNTIIENVVNIFKKTYIKEEKVVLNQHPSFTDLMNGTAEEFQQALDQGAEYEPEQLFQLLEKHTHDSPPEEKKDDTFSPVEGIVCDMKSMTYQLDDPHMFMPGVGYNITEKRCSAISRLIALKKIGYSKNLKGTIPMIDAPENTDCENYARCNNLAIVTYVGNCSHSYCAECQTEKFPKMDIDPFLVVAKENFGKDVPECGMCMEIADHYVITNSCDCIRNGAAVCTACFENWCQHRFRGHQEEDDDGNPGDWVYDGDRFVKCPYCNQKFIPF
jgi:uncharacterized Zn-finger protein